MPVLAIVTGEGITKKMYDSIRLEVKWESQHPNGAMLHVCGFDESGALHVADIWESAEAMQKFFETRLVPAMEKLKIPAPQVDIYPAHNINAFSAIERYRMK